MGYEYIITVLAGVARLALDSTVVGTIVSSWTHSAFCRALQVGEKGKEKGKKWRRVRELDIRRGG